MLEAEMGYKKLETSKIGHSFILLVLHSVRGLKIIILGVAKFV